MEIYKCPPRKLAGYIEDIMYAGLTPFVQSSPGMGKSSIMAQVAKKNNLELIDHRLSTSAPEDLSGLPRFTQDGRAEFAPFTELFPIEGMTPPTGKQGWMIFLDELNSAPEEVQAAAYKLVLDRKTGQKKIHSHSVITAAGNFDTDRAVTTSIGTALQSRLVWLELELSFDQWLEDVALANNYSPLIIAYLSQYERYLMDFRPDHQDKTFCCPRTWEFMNRLIIAKNGKVSPDDTALYAGTITSGVAANFVAYCQLEGNILKYEDVMADPANVPIPHATDAQWIITTLLIGKAKEENLDSIGTFIDRLPMTNRVLFYKGLIAQHPECRSHPVFARGLLALNRYLNEA